MGELRNKPSRLASIIAIAGIVSFCSMPLTASAQDSGDDTSECDEIVGIGSGGMSFENRTINIQAGGTVCWIWDNETMAHNVAQAKDNSENSRMIGGVYSGAPNVTVDFRHSFEENQTFYYLCEPHAAVMKGIVVVGSGGSSGETSPEESDTTPGFSTAFALLSLTAAAAFARPGRP